MKLTEQKLRQLIREELNSLNEASKAADITIGKKEYKLVRKGSRIHLINVKYSSDKYIFGSEDAMKSFLDDQVDPIGGTQSSQF
jgi:hypothetical protein